MWATISSIITLAAVVVVAQPAAAERPSFNPPVGAIFSKHGSDGAVPAEPLTNGKRFAVGLPPLPPKPRHHGRNSARGTSQAALWLSADSFRVAVGSKVDSARRAVASPSLPVTATCLLEAVDKSSGASYGYVTTDYNMGFATISTTGNFRWLSFTYTPTDPASLSGLNVRSGTNDHPYFGLTMSYYSSNNDLSAGNANYAWFSTTDLTGKTPTVTGNSPQDAQGAEQASESPLWEYNPVTGAMTPTWYNTDGSPVTTVPVRVGSDLYATGNYALLATSLGRPDMNAIIFRAVQCRYT